ncbi:TetR/AcrR family transcriptional regulator [Rhodococcus erythropolis]|uniref:TetR/AcrR family transcriptional regulator n=1 Tax=Rhodococcus erythropolis TaxID=1833 RepID=UPI000696A672|nr:TetR-like C-terminal domain-containing protein [Rhodococcus erythropolis]
MALTGIPPAAFMRSGNPDDPRAKRTRALLLTEAEREIALSGRLPTVATLTQAAGVSRGAFYTHFRSIDELAVTAVRAALEEFGAGAGAESVHSESARAQLGYSAFFAHIAEHRPLFATLVATSSDGSAREELREALILQTVHAVSASKNKPQGLDPRQGAAYIVSGILGILSEWLCDPLPIDPDQLADQISELLPAWLLDDKQIPSVHVDLR